MSAAVEGRKVVMGADARVDLRCAATGDCCAV
jgi:hypothetical protein